MYLIDGDKERAGGDSLSGTPIKGFIEYLGLALIGFEGGINTRETYFHRDYDNNIFVCFFPSGEDNRMNFLAKRLEVTQNGLEEIPFSRGLIEVLDITDSD